MKPFDRPCLVGVDPGKTSGWALFEPPEWNFTKVYETKEGTQTDAATLLAETKELQVSGLLWVVEDYLVRPGKDGRPGTANWWQRPPSVEVIGMIRYHCKLHKQRMHLNQPTQKVQGYRWAGFRGPDPHKHKTRMVHINDAIAHGFQFLVANSHRLPVRTAPTEVD